MKITLQHIQQKKADNKKLTMLTAYDYPLARLLDEVGVDIVLIGDSVANVVLGLETTPEVGMKDMLHHTRAVTRAVKRSFVVGDMPFESYQPETSDPVECAQQFIDAGCDAVKLEWFPKCFDVAKAIIDAGIPVMGHVGLTPQTAEKFTVQGRDEATAKAIMDNARALDAAGCFAMVLECVPTALAQQITDGVHAMTIGIGAGVYCDGQVLVTHDLLGLFHGKSPKFAKRYVDLNEQARVALNAFKSEVESGSFPDDKHSWT